MTPCMCVCSLGMVFLSVTDSSDIGVELHSAVNKWAGLQTLSEGAKLETATNQAALSESAYDANDLGLAEQLQVEAIEYQVNQDAHLAEQLQLKENSYMTPRCVCGGVSN